MNLDSVVKIFGLATALFGVATYFADKLLARRNNTIEKVGELIDDYHENYANLDINKDYRKIVRYLSKVEHFCIAVDSRVYSRRTLKKYGSKFLIDLFQKYKGTVIAKRREQYDDSKYQYLEKVVKWFDCRRNT